MTPAQTTERSSEETAAVTRLVRPAAPSGRYSPLAALVSNELMVASSVAFEDHQPGSS